MKDKIAKKIANHIRGFRGTYQCVVTDETGSRNHYLARTEYNWNDGVGATEPVEENPVVVLVPVTGKGSNARARGQIPYAYDMGGRMFRAAVDAARLIERYL